MSEDSGWSTVEAICQQALDRPSGERRAFVADACGDNDGLRREVESLLAHINDDAFLESPLAAVAAHAFAGNDSSLSGARLGSLHVGSVIGRGGMGEVYVARDVRLERDVAIKVLPALFARDPDRLTRFKREAVILASLNHPNIAAIYGVEELGDAQALVLELVEGATLDERLRQGGLSIEEAVSIAKQIVDALEAAHERGIVHRDLKPANVKLRPDGVVKVLDFGLATAFDPAGSPIPSPPDTETNATDTSGIFGTPRYMSPEHRAGRATDKRSDIWAFGAVLYEMLTGETPSPEERARGIECSTLPGSAPEALRRLIARCLERNPRQRLRDIGEARVMLEGLALDSLESTLPRGRSPGARRLIAAATALIAAAAAGTAVWWAMPQSPPGATRLLIGGTGEAALFVDPQSNDVAISPSGGRVVYKGGSSGEQTRLFVRDIDRLEPRALTGPGLPKGPFFSPDGAWVGYFEPGLSVVLKKVAIAGGPSQVLAYFQGPTRGASWGTDGTIVAATAVETSGLMRVSDSGGDLEVLTIPDAQHGERDHVWPHHLPGGKSILFTVTSASGDREANVIAVLDVASRVWRPILRGASQARYLRSGHLLYVAGDALWVVPFDLLRLRTHGAAKVVVPHVLVLPTGTAEFDVASDGTIVYVADAAAATRRRLVWVDRSGREEEITEAPPRLYAEPRLSPDGSRIAVAIDDGGHDIWVWDIARGSLSHVTMGPAIELSPLWSADGRRLFFTSTGGGTLGALFWQAADGSGTAERLTDSGNVRKPTSVFANGRCVLYTEDGDIMSLTLNEARSATPVLRAPGPKRDGVVSPDGRWIAFESLDNGTGQVFVRPFPNVNDARVQISVGGGLKPQWSRDGRELFFLAPDGALMGVDVPRGQTWRASRPVPVIARNVFADVSISLRHFDVTPDGRRFLLVKGTPGGVAPAPQIVVVENWLTGIALNGSR